MNTTKKRSIGRREEDIAVRHRNNRFQKLYNIGQTITSEIHMEALFGLVMDQTNKIMNTERSTLSENSKLFIGPETYSKINDIYPCDFIGDCRLKTSRNPYLFSGSNPWAENDT
jgi:hypothetical protein